MRRRVFARLALAAVAALGLGADRPSDVRGIRHWSYPEFTRVAIELSRPTRASLDRLGADARAGRPERLYLDLADLWVGHHLDAPIPVGDGLLRGIRVGQFKSDTARVVIDLAALRPAPDPHADESAPRADRRVRDARPAGAARAAARGRRAAQPRARTEPAGGASAGHAPRADGGGGRGARRQRPRRARPGRAAREGRHARRGARARAAAQRRAASAW